MPARPRSTSRTASHGPQGAFNARWLSPSQVATTFVPTSQFGRLLAPRHSVLSGPRGCGKTTLLKMLTREAIASWQARRDPQPAAPSFDPPTFEAIYVPSDIRWNTELETVLGESAVRQEVERALINASIVLGTIDTLRSIFGDGDSRTLEAERALSTQLAAAFGLSIDNPTLFATRIALRLVAADLRSNPPGVADHRKLSIPSLDLVSLLFETCDAFVASQGRKRPSHWAFCFDELEISPAWLRGELISGLRSVDQRILLKLTWTPLLPSRGEKSPEGLHDFDDIPLWYGHLDTDAFTFSEALCAQALTDQLGPGVQAYSLLGRSPFGRTEGSTRALESVRTKVFASLAGRDPSFAGYLEGKRIDSSKPIPTTPDERSAVFRKVAQLVFLRDALWDPTKARSRKVTDVYYGAETLFALSDGNPRVLLGLLGNLVARIDWSRPQRGSSRMVPIRAQARVFRDSSLAFLRYVWALPTRGAESKDRRLIDLVMSLGNRVRQEIVGHAFQPDPIGSFIVDREVSEQTRGLLRDGIELGVFVVVPSSGGREVEVGPRLRLAFRLAPAFGLPLRNNRFIRLSEALDGTPPGQLRLQFEPPNLDNEAWTLEE